MAPWVAQKCLLLAIVELSGISPLQRSYMSSRLNEKDILKLLPAPKKPPKLTSRRIGIHTSTAGGVHNAAERAYRLGCNASPSAEPRREVSGKP